MKHTVQITEQDGVVRVDKHLAQINPEYSRSALAKLFTLKLIKFRGESIQPGFKIRPGQEYEYDLGPLQAKPDVVPLPILYEDDDIIVVNKPSGIISHARGRFWQEASVASFIRDRIQGMSGERGGIVHRLDRPTSGVMMCAKNEQMLKYLQKQFNDRTVEKTYIAVTSRKPKQPEAVIDAPIARNPKDPKSFMVDELGKASQTYYTVSDEQNKRSQLVLQPKTGRTHQLRVHLAYINCPIVGDDLYDGEPHERLLLHAYSLSVPMPSGDMYEFIAPVPVEFDEALHADK